MQEFVVSARKYRPQKFIDLVGQDHITKTLKNAIKNGNLAQSFIFCGPRGVGKTTCARILAKAINCLDAKLTSEPCNTCKSCISFNKNSSFNIYELDAASNNSVEDIRSLVEQVRYAPQFGKYKIYIIDEVHMLSNAAFNAFLKTLEEPPSYAIFILATTEKHKIIPTILSRCQIYDFSRISFDNIVKHLKYVANTEKISADIEALNVISKKADGALRDALSMFDLIVTYNEGKKLTYTSTLENLHILDYEYYFKIIDIIMKKHVTQIFSIINDIEKKGFNLLNFITGFSEHLRNILMMKCSKSLNLDFSEKIIDRYINQSMHLEKKFIIGALNIISKCELDYKLIKNKKLSIELALINIVELLSHSKNISSVPTIDKKITEQKEIKINKTQKNENMKKYSTLNSSELPKLQSKVDNYANKTINKKNNNLDSTLEILNLDEINTLVNKTPKSHFKEKNVRYQDLNEEKIQDAWKNFLNTLKKEGKYTEYNILNHPLIINQETIFVTLHSELHKVIFQEIKQKAKNYIVEKTQYNIKNIMCKVSNKKQEHVPYTNKEKFEYLEKQNCNLTKLKQVMNLDLDI